MICMELRFFSRRVFGAWVDARVVRVSRTGVTLKAHFHGATWHERVALDTEFYYPRGHLQQGEAFRLGEHVTTTPGGI